MMMLSLAPGETLPRWMWTCLEKSENLSRTDLVPGPAPPPVRVVRSTRIQILINVTSVPQRAKRSSGSEVSTVTGPGLVRAVAQSMASMAYL